nr:pentatricopeptide repeat-containing protein At4g21065 [Ipomoea batatas]
MQPLPSSTLPISVQQNPKPYILKKCIALLLSCASSNHKLRQVHAFAIRRGIPLSSPDMGRGYAESENPGPAIGVHTQMCVNSVAPDTHTYPFLLKAIAKLMAVREGEKAESAHYLFEGMSEKNLVAWNSVINGYAVNSRPNETLTLYRKMELEGVRPDGFTLVSLLTASAELGALALGRRAHVYMVKVGLDRNLHAANSLLDLYAKCGNIREARQVFDELEEESVVSWTSLIVGLAVNGFGKMALELFKEMERRGFVSTEITFVGVLYACSHCGMVDEGFAYFERMQKEFGIKPKIEHYGCMVDLLGRAGLVKRAYEYIKNMPLEPNAVIWRTLLGACSIHGHLELGEVARSKLMQLEPTHSGDFVLLSNLYASERRWSDVHTVRKTMLQEGVKKVPGHSLVELGNCVHEFVMGDRTHPQTEAIYAKLAEMTNLLRIEGYVPHTSNVLADIEEEEKETALSYHSEKIAIAFVLINTPPGTPIRIVKNLRPRNSSSIILQVPIVLPSRLNWFSVLKSNDSMPKSNDSMPNALATELVQYYIASAHSLAVKETLIP